MFAQIQSFSITSLDELVISPSQFNDFMTDADNCSHPIGALYTSTVRILRHASWLANQKATLTKQEYKELLSKFNWEGEEKAYLKIDEAFNNIFAPYQLVQIEPRTIFLIALNQKKYQSVITQMQTLPIITPDLVRSLMKQCHKPRAKKDSEEASIWRMMPDNKRACVIGPIYNQSVGVILEKMMKKEHRTAQSIVEEALVARYEFKYGFPIEEDNQDSEKSVPNLEEEVSTDVTQDVSETAPQEKEVTQDVLETVPVQEEEVTSGNQTTPDYEGVALNNSIYSWDSDQVTEEYLEETLSYSSWSDNEEDVTSDTWSFEPEEKDDFIEDYELTQAVDIQPQEMAPADILIQALRTATSWQEISEALKVGEEYKQEAWDALTQLERSRMIELTPPTIKRLSYAKREGLIAEFRMEREGVYHIRENGSFIWDIVFEYRVEEYLARLVIK